MSNNMNANNDVKNPSFEYCLRLGNDREIIIGDIESADLRIIGESVNRDNIVLRWTDGNLIIKSFMSESDVIVNGVIAENGMIIGEKSYFSLAGYWFYYDNHRIFFDNSDIKSKSGDISPIIKNSDFAYPIFIRNTRQKIKVNNEPIAVLDPPAKPNKPTTNIVTSLLPAIAMLGLTFVLRGVMGSSGSFAIFAVLSMGVGVITSVVSLVMSKRDYRIECKKRKEDYSMYSRRKEEEIIQCRNDELENLREIYYSIEEDVKHFKDFDSRLFDRIPEDEDFLDVYLGLGKIESKRQVDYKHQETMDVEDNITQIPMNLANQYRYIEKAPIVLKLRESNVVGVVGSDAHNNILIENIIVDLMARQYYGDIDIYFLMDESDEQKFSWIRLLPYFNNEDGVRTIVNDNDSKNYIFEYLYKQLSFRQSEKVGGKHNVVLVKKEHGIKSHPISRFIENAAELNTSFIFFEEKEDLLPLYCSYIIKLNSNEEGLIYSSEDKINKTVFRFQQINDVAKKMLMERVTPIKVEDISLDSSLRKSITLFELLNICEAEDLEVGERWNESKIYDSMAVPIGVNVKEEIVYLNLHEKFDGPHGLVAGTTGSGKSELLQSYILGAAARFRPTEVGFLVIDFKGGGMVNQFKDLPHLLGAITNIDGKAIDRSLKSIKAELLKRQELFAEAGVNNIDKYIKLYKEGKVTEALPHLIIVVDEFAELKSEQPEFMKELISAARIGRSLGVHLILATQKPAGQVDDQIWSNSRFKICLKVQTREDSNEVLKSPLAAEIKEPGRAYIQVGNNEIFELFQSGFSGAPEKVDSNQKNYSIAKVEFNGRKTIYKASEKVSSKNNRTQLEAVVDYINNYCKDNGVKELRNICLPPLPEVVVCDDITIGKTNEMLCPIGIYDDPDRQNQDVATIDVSTANAFIVGSAQYGKTNLLADIVKNLSSIYSPDEVNIYIFDFASMVLKNLEKLNHVGGVVVPSDEERAKNLFKYLYEQLEYRRNKLLEAGVSSFVSYKEAGHYDLPQIVVLVDNLTALKELYFEQEDSLLPLTREGLSVGISFVVSNVATTGIGYRYLANFAKKIALFNNDKSEYSSLFGRTNLYPEEFPGRALVEIDKSIYECQTYLAFEGEKEIHRVENMLKFIDVMNSKYEGMKAVPIPEIPELLTEQYLNEEYAANNDGQLVVGLDYDVVAPDVLEFAKNNCISISGRENSGKANIIKYMVRNLSDNMSDSKVYVFDNYRKKLEDLSKDSRVSYTISTDGVTDAIREIHDEIEIRYNALASEMDYGSSYRIIVVNNEDAHIAISEDKEALECIKKLSSKYKMLNVIMIFGNVPNEQANYGAPEIYRFIKENTNVIFFEDLQLCKMFDFPLSLMREKSKRLSLGDAYHIIGNEVKRIKTPLVIS